jgi:two-component system, OmpR family, response regulator VicR
MSTSAAGESTPLVRGQDLDNLEFDSPHRRIMIIDDEVDTVDLVKYVLMEAGMDVISAYTGDEAIKRITQNSPDVILLDLMMPDIDGWRMYEEIRQVTKIPVIIVSALTDKEHVVKGLKFGADDYIAKPFYPSELVARINRVSSKTHLHHLSQIYRFPANGLVIDSNTREVLVDGRKIILPAREFGVLASLARRPGRWVDLATIAVEVWNDSKILVQNRIKYLIFLLRSQLERDPKNPRLILSREGLGYKLAVPPGLGSHSEEGDGRLDSSGRR